MNQILIVEDDDALGRGLTLALGDRYRCTRCIRAERLPL